jgi:hypothetical protein
MGIETQCWQITKQAWALDRKHVQHLTSSPYFSLQKVALSSRWSYRIKLLITERDLPLKHTFILPISDESIPPTILDHVTHLYNCQHVLINDTRHIRLISHNSYVKGSRNPYGMHLYVPEQTSLTLHYAVRTRSEQTSQNVVTDPLDHPDFCDD